MCGIVDKNKYGKRVDRDEIGGCWGYILLHLSYLVYQPRERGRGKQKPQGTFT